MSIASRKCIRCQAAIPPERLKVLPETQLCVPCSQAVGSDFETVIVSENIGKAGSLKKNYGGISVKKRRRKIQPLEGDEEKAT
jgi:Prokaryotic dksA/traR C4-type zinc finger